MFFNVLAVRVFFFVKEEDCLFGHLCSKYHQVGRASTGEASTASGATSRLVIKHMKKNRAATCRARDGRCSRVVPTGQCWAHSVQAFDVLTSVGLSVPKFLREKKQRPPLEEGQVITRGSSSGGPTCLVRPRFQAVSARPAPKC